MPNARQDLRVLLYDTYTEASRVLQADLSERWTGLTFSSSLHGGFRSCSLRIPMQLAQAWLALRSENRGWHYYHLEITEDHSVVWEGRIVTAGISLGGRRMELQLTALGYWSSLRDQYYVNASITSNSTADDLIKDILTTKCPDISTDQSNIDANSRDIQNGGNDEIDLSVSEYPQEIIVNKLGPIADSDGSQFFGAVWEDRIFYWKSKTLAQIDWFVYLDAIMSGRLEQDGLQVRNTIIPVADGVIGTAASNVASQSIYPARELQVTVPKGLVDAGDASDDMRDAILLDRQTPRQSQSVRVSGRVYSTAASRTLGAASGAMVDRPKWWVRAGEVLRIQDLIPESVASPAFDDLRTFWIRETNYDAGSDTLTVQPDTPAFTLARLLPRLGKIERDT